MIHVLGSVRWRNRKRLPLSLRSRRLKKLGARHLMTDWRTMIYLGMTDVQCDKIWWVMTFADRQAEWRKDVHHHKTLYGIWHLHMYLYWIEGWHFHHPFHTFVMILVAGMAWVTLINVTSAQTLDSGEVQNVSLKQVLWSSACALQIVIYNVSDQPWIPVPTHHQYSDGLQEV